MATDRQFAGDDRALVICLRLQCVGDTADHDFRSRWRHDPGFGYTVTEAFNEQSAVRVEHDLDDCRIVERYAELVAKCVLEFADKSCVGAELGHAALLVE